MQQFKYIVNEIRDMYKPFHEGNEIWTDTTEKDSQNLVLPPWLCQCYMRDTPENHVKKVEDKRKEFVENHVSIDVYCNCNNGHQL